MKCPLEPWCFFLERLMNVAAFRLGKGADGHPSIPEVGSGVNARDGYEHSCLHADFARKKLRELFLNEGVDFLDAQLGHKKILVPREGIEPPSLP